MNKIKQQYIFCLYLVIFMLSCKKNIKSDCEVYNEIFIEYDLKNQPDSALIYIDKAIKCDSKDEFYKFSKINFLIRQKNYLEASKLLEIINTDNKLSFQMLDAVLNMKIRKDTIDQKLISVYKKVKQSKFHLDSNIFAYKIVLDNYFIGKEYALNEVLKAKKMFEDYNSELILSSVELNIKNETKEKVIYKLFNFE